MPEARSFAHHHFLTGFSFCSFACNAMRFSEQSIQSRNISSGLLDYTISRLMPFTQCIWLKWDSICNFAFGANSFLNVSAIEKRKWKRQKEKNLQVAAKILHACWPCRSLIMIIIMHASCNRLCAMCNHPVVFHLSPIRQHKINTD